MAEESVECDRVGRPMPDIAGLGILIAFASQALISLLLAAWVFALSEAGRLDVQHEIGTLEHKIELNRLEAMLDILMIGNDIQVLTGAALMISAFADDAIDLYHLHLIFDTVSFVGVSNAAALVTWTFCIAKHPNSSKYAKRKKKTFFFGRRLLTTRHRASYLFAVLFLILAVLLCVRLHNHWSTDLSAPLGSCFRVNGILAAPGAAHPTVDIVYVALTATWLVIVMFAAIYHGPRLRHSILIAAAGQFPVHMYGLIALRTANLPLLESEGGEEENDWDFGQTTSILLLSVTVNQFFEKLIGLWRFERALKKEQQLPRAVDAEAQVEGVEEKAKQERLHVQVEEGSGDAGEVTGGSHVLPMSDTAEGIVSHARSI